MPSDRARTEGHHALDVQVDQPYFVEALGLGQARVAERHVELQPAAGLDDLGVHRAGVACRLVGQRFEPGAGDDDRVVVTAADDEHPYDDQDGGGRGTHRQDPGAHRRAAWLALEGHGLGRRGAGRGRDGSGAARRCGAAAAGRDRIPQPGRWLVPGEVLVGQRPHDAAESGQLRPFGVVGIDAAGGALGLAASGSPEARARPGRRGQEAASMPSR